MEMSAAEGDSCCESLLNQACENGMQLGRHWILQHATPIHRLVPEIRSGDLSGTELRLAI